MPDWPSLWEREPGLRPPGLDGYGDSWGQDWIEPDGTIDAGVNDRIGVPVAAALCRDAAVRWLCDLDSSKELRLCHGRRFSGARPWEASLWHIMAGGEEDICDASAEGETIDEAVFSLCKAVLDARAKP